MLAPVDNSVNRYYIHGRIMARPGPKPVDEKQLATEATQWACFFYTLRDGQPGYMQKVGKLVPAPLPPRSSSPWVGFSAGEGTIALPSELVYRRNRPVRLMSAEALGPPTFIPVPEEPRAVPSGRVEINGEYWHISAPIFPKPEVWARLKKAHTSLEIKAAARLIGELEPVFASSTAWAQSPASALSHFAKGLLDAKMLPHYPATERGRSDDKRIVFFAKVMAGLTLGLRPITAVKRLSHWTWPKNWAEKPLREFVERQEQRFQERHRGSKKL